MPRPRAPFLITPRIEFGWWSSDDLELAMELWGDPRVTALIDARGALSREQVRARLEQEIATQRAHGCQYWPIYARRGGALLGCCGLRPRDVGAGVFEFGVHLCRASWGQGLATEAARAVIEHAFGALQVRALFAGHNPSNHASRRLLMRLGVRHTHDELYPPTGLMHPSYTMCPGDQA